MTEPRVGAQWDLRRLPGAGTAVRRLAVRRVLAGESPGAVTRSLSLCRTSIYRWLRAYRRAGLVGLVSPKRVRGRPPRVPPQAVTSLRALIVGRTPREHGLEGMLWTRELVRDVALSRCGVDTGRVGAGRLLKRMGLRIGRPLAALRRRDAEAVAEWLGHARSVLHVGRSGGARVAVLRAYPAPDGVVALAVASDLQGRFYCEDCEPPAGWHQPAVLAAFLGRCAALVDDSTVFVHDDPGVWTPALAAAGMSGRESTVGSRRLYRAVGAGL